MSQSLLSLCGPFVACHLLSIAACQCSLSPFAQCPLSCVPDSYLKLLPTHAIRSYLHPTLVRPRCTFTHDPCLLSPAPTARSCYVSCPSRTLPVHFCPSPLACLLLLAHTVRSQLPLVICSHLVLQGPVKSSSWPPWGFNRQPQPDRTTVVLRDRTEHPVLERPDPTAVQSLVVTGPKPSCGQDWSSTGLDRS